MSSAFAQYSNCREGRGTAKTINSKMINCLHTSHQIHSMIELMYYWAYWEVILVFHLDSRFKVKIRLCRYSWQLITKLQYILWKIKPDFHVILRFQKIPHSATVCDLGHWAVSSLGSSSLLIYQQLDCKVVFSLSTHTTAICISKFYSFNWMRWIIQLDI